MARPRGHREQRPARQRAAVSIPGRPGGLTSPHTARGHAELLQNGLVLRRRGGRAFLNGRGAGERRPSREAQRAGRCTPGWPPGPGRRRSTEGEGGPSGRGPCPRGFSACEARVNPQLRSSEGCLQHRPAAARGAVALGPPPRTEPRLGTRALAERASYLSELLVDDSVDLVGRLHLPGEQGRQHVPQRHHPQDGPGRAGVGPCQGGDMPTLSARVRGRGQGAAPAKTLPGPPVHCGQIVTQRAPGSLCGTLSRVASSGVLGQSREEPVTRARVPCLPVTRLLRARPAAATRLPCSHRAQDQGTQVLRPKGTVRPGPRPGHSSGTRCMTAGPKLWAPLCRVAQAGWPAVGSTRAAGTDPDSSTTGAWSKPLSRRTVMVCSQVTVGSTVSGADRLRS